MLFLWIYLLCIENVYPSEVSSGTIVIQLRHGSWRKISLDSFFLDFYGRFHGCITRHSSIKNALYH